MPEVIMPRLSDTMTEGAISSWLKHEGDSVNTGDVLAEIETDKAVMELEAYESGKLTKILVSEGKTVPIGTVIAVIGDPSSPLTTPPSSQPSPQPLPTQPASSDQSNEPPQSAPATETSEHLTLRATPLVRHLAKEHGVDLTAVRGTGPGGRIVRADIEAYIAAESSSSHTVGQPPQQQPPQQQAPQQPINNNNNDDDECIPLTPIRRITAQRLTESATVPHFHLNVAANVDALIALRSDLNTQLAADNPSPIKISFTDMLIRACAVTLAHHREMNCSWAGDHLIRHQHINIGCAVAMNAGLVVPVIVDADKKSLTEITANAHYLIDRARNGRLAPNEMTGGTFTISNLGGYGIESFVAVINPPEAAILAVGSIGERAIIRDGMPAAAHMLELTLTLDHRVIDGAVAAEFLQDLKHTLENPLKILA